jgi:long-chain acyl-CoA synthetase
MLRIILPGIAIAALAGAALAAEVGGVKLDDKVNVGGKELVLNGAGVRTRAVFKVYVGSLYLPAKANTAATVLANGPRRVQLNLLRNLSADQLVDALVEGLKENTSEAEFAAIKPQTDQMVAIMKSFGEVKEGNVVTLDYVDGITRIALNGQAKGQVPGEPFSHALTRVWIGDKPVQNDLKKAMLGEGR